MAQAFRCRERSIETARWPAAPRREKLSRSGASNRSWKLGPRRRRFHTAKNLTDKEPRILDSRIAKTLGKRRVKKEGLVLGVERLDGKTQ
jgi:hypothetical protein